MFLVFSRINGRTVRQGTYTRDEAIARFQFTPEALTALSYEEVPKAVSRRHPVETWAIRSTVPAD